MLLAILWLIIWATIVDSMYWNTDNDEGSRALRLGGERCYPNGFKRRVDNCNYCICSQGMNICTKINCPRSNLKYAIPDCNFGITKTVKCNHCICRLEKWLCTKKDCNGKVEVRPNNKTVPFYLEPCKTIRDYRQLDSCNFCVCLNHQWYCRNEVCPTPPPPQVTYEFTDPVPECNINDHVFKIEGCNRCKCLAQRWLCTKKVCDGDKEVPQKQPVKPFYLETCDTDRDVRKLHECNNCLCLNHEWYCEHRNCDRVKRIIKINKQPMPRKPGLIYLKGIYRSNDKPEVLKNDYGIFNSLRRIKKECDQFEVISVDACNRCHCLAHRWVCTQQDCISKLKGVSKADGYFPVSSKETCKVGVIKHLYNCGHCKCFGGAWYCNYADCYRKTKDKNPKNNKTNPTRPSFPDKLSSLEKTPFMNVPNDKLPLNEISYFNKIAEFIKKYKKGKHQEKYHRALTERPINFIDQIFGYTTTTTSIIIDDDNDKKKNLDVNEDVGYSDKHSHKYYNFAESEDSDEHEYSDEHKNSDEPEHFNEQEHSIEPEHSDNHKHYEEPENSNEREHPNEPEHFDDHEHSEEPENSNEREHSNEPEHSDDHENTEEPENSDEHEHSDKLEYSDEQEHSNEYHHSDEPENLNQHEEPDKHQDNDEYKDSDYTKDDTSLLDLPVTCKTTDKLAIDCFECKCLKDNIWTCTKLKNCNRRVPMENIFIRRKKECDRWEVIHVDTCNRCHCLAGRWVCTQRDCISKLKEVSTADGYFPVPNKETCKDGDIQNLNNCGYCKCIGKVWYCNHADCSLKSNDKRRKKKKPKPTAPPYLNELLNKIPYTIAIDKIPFDQIPYFDELVEFFEQYKKGKHKKENKRPPTKAPINIKNDVFGSTTTTKTTTEEPHHNDQIQVPDEPPVLDHVTPAPVPHEHEYLSFFSWWHPAYWWFKIQTG